MVRKHLTISEMEHAVAWSHTERSRTLHKLIRHGGRWLRDQVAQRNRAPRNLADEG
jgi:hypothetical protein